MTATITKPCTHCQRRLHVHFDTVDGELVERPDPCDCEDARWRRGECADCGIRVRPVELPPNRRWNNFPKRCPKHDAEYRRLKDRERKRELYRENPEEERAKFRIRYHTDPECREQALQRSRDYHAEVKRFNQRRLAAKRQALEARNREIFQKVEEEGMRSEDVGEQYGISGRMVRKIVKKLRESEWQVCEQKEAA